MSRHRMVRLGALVLVLGVAGCATRADLVAQDRRLRGMLQDQKRSIDEVKREIERLRAQVEEGSGRRGGRGGGDDRLSALEQRLAALEGGAGKPPPAAPPPTEQPGATPGSGSEGPPLPQVEPPVETASKPPSPAPVPTPPPSDDEWRREVQQEQATAATLNVPERDEYVKTLDDLGRRDCAKAVPALNGLASKNKGSVLADNAIYWAARCYAARGDQNQAISKFYDVVTRYPKSDKAPAALWQQGNLFLQIGDTPDARLALGKLIRDYPNSSEAAQARQKLSELEH